MAAQRGHDIFQVAFASPAPFEDEVIDHREIVEEVEAKLGKMTPLAERSIFNPKTKKYFGFSDLWAPGPVPLPQRSLGPDRSPAGHLGGRPRRREIKAQGHPIGIGMGHDPESNLNLMGLMHAFGASIQDEDANVVINSPATVEAVKMGAAIFQSGMTEEVVGWDVPSNNRYLASGRASLILNSIPAIRAIEIQDPDLAAKIQLLPIPRGPRGRLSPYGVSSYMIWKFSRSQEAAKRFLVDLAIDYREAFIQSQYLQMPSFPGAVKDLGELVANDARAQPPGKYGFLAEAAEWSTNLGHPGYSNAATDEVLKASLVSQMFAAAARGEMSAEDAVRAAEAQIKPIFERWRQQAKI